jgi:hypothetical protein
MRINKKSLVLSTITVLLSVVLVITAVNAASNLNVPDGALSGGSPIASMKTLEDIYQRIVAGTEAGSHNLTPASSPAGTMHTLSDIYSAVPTNDKVCSGTNAGTANCSGGVPKTGQTTSYADYDDGYYEKGLPSSGDHFTNNGDGTITDNTTGLEWVASPTAAGVGGTYTWANAITACEGLTYAGHSDWRLPNTKELQSIVDYSRASPAIDTTYFTSASSIYWSSTTGADVTDFAWGVDFNSGYVSIEVKTNTDYVRPVRGG